MAISNRLTTTPSTINSPPPTNEKCCHNTGEQAPICVTPRVRDVKHFQRNAQLIRLGEQPHLHHTHLMDK